MDVLKKKVCTYFRAKRLDAQAGDLLIAFAGPAMKTREQMGKMRAELGTKLGFRGTDKGYHGLWVVDFPLVEFDEEDNRWTAMHHPFTSPKPEDFELMKTDPGKILFKKKNSNGQKVPSCLF